MAVIIMMMIMVNAVEHSLTLVEALGSKRYWYRKKYFLRINERGFESRENCFEADFKLFMHR